MGAQTPSSVANLPRPSASASAVAEAPTLDGDVLGDPAWAAATPIDGFLQELPVEGDPASERTEVRVVYTRDTLYIGAVMYDREPDAIVVSDSRRDAPLDDVDSFRVIFDTYRDRQNGFVFGTNPAGVEYDGQVTLEGQGGGGLTGGGQQSSGSGSGFNVNWDGAWQVRIPHHRDRLERRVRHSVQDAALPVRQRPDVGRQLPAHHPAPQRARLLGADPAPVQPLPGVAGRHAQRHHAHRRCAT